MIWNWIFVIIFILATIAQIVTTFDSKRTGNKVFHLLCAAAYFIIGGFYLIEIILNFV